MSKSLVITLGHNSSAIVIENGHVLGGYEEERFTNKKADSSFPMNSVLTLMATHGHKFDNVYVGHWFTGGAIGPSKYVDLEFLRKLTDGDIVSIHDGLTHHDTHMHSAESFAKHYGFPEDRTTIVADGFGTYGECISIYHTHQGKTRLTDRYFGYGDSLGILYQYATAYLGMKMHNHEYKMLGYEAHILEVLDTEAVDSLNSIIFDDAKLRLKRLFEEPINKDTDPIVNTAALAAAQHEINQTLDSVLDRMSLPQLSIHDKRIVISYYVQGIVEAVMTSLVDTINPQNLLVVGGLFYNVKVNHLLAQRVEKFCVMPISGDQGAGLGVYQAAQGDLVWPGHVAWGHRDLNQVRKFSTDNLIVVNSMDQAYDLMYDHLRTNKMVNIVRGSMEFGPRSLCNTATIAIPDMDVVERINEMNDRTTVMPMAPAMTASQASEMLLDTDKIVGSLNYMICTRSVKPEYHERMAGASHKYALTGEATCRPQIIPESDTLMTNLLNSFGPLINTSFNYHGVPIAFDAPSIKYSHDQQNTKGAITTVVLAE